MNIDYAWRGETSDAALNALHAAAFDHGVEDFAWTRQLEAHSLGWVTGHHDGDLVGFVNVAWDGGTHAFILDTMVDLAMHRRGIGTGLIGIAAAEARAAGCHWLHVDFESHLDGFYFDACRFVSTKAGLIALN